MTGDGASRLSAVIVNYRTPAATLDAAHSILASHRQLDDLIIVDNGSGDDSEGWLRDRLRSATIVQTGRNRGFAFGCNVGLQIARERGATGTILVNSDAHVTPDCIARLEKAAFSGANVAVVSPVLVSARDHRTVEEAGVRLSSRTGRMFQSGAGQSIDRIRFSGTREVDAVSGCVMLVTHQALDRIGLLDEDYFFSFEDFDFCRRARANGMRILVEGDAVAYHHGHLTIGSTSSDRLYYAARNHLLLFSRTGSQLSIAGRAARACSIVALNLARAALRPPGIGRLRAIQAVWLGTRDHLFARSGEIPRSLAANRA